MLCSNPIRVKNAENYKRMVSCGRCMPCRITKRGRWTARMLLEAKTHEENCFVTLTYDPENLPLDGKITKRDCQLFLKRLRRSYPDRISYFLCGEYGSKTKRPHYHLILFGFPYADSRYLTKAWSKGFITCSPLTTSRASYVAKYTLKGSDSDATFSMMSGKPAIGKSFIPIIGKALRTLDVNFGSSERSPTKIPPAIRIGGKIYPLDSYMRKQLEIELGEKPRNSLGLTVAHDLKAEYFIKVGDPEKETRDTDAAKAARNLNITDMHEKL